MRVHSTLEGAPAHDELRSLVETRFRFALGGLASEVQVLRVHLGSEGAVHRCTATLILVDGLELVLESGGSSFDEVMGFVARRAASAVSLRISTNRFLGS